MGDAMPVNAINCKAWCRVAFVFAISVSSGVAQAFSAFGLGAAGDVARMNQQQQAQQQQYQFQQQQLQLQQMQQERQMQEQQLQMEQQRLQIEKEKVELQEAKMRLQRERSKNNAPDLAASSLDK
jgi:TolA-binding protein